MKINIPQLVGIRFRSTASIVKRAVQCGVNYISDVLERNPSSDVFISSTSFSKTSIDKTDKKYVEIINQVPVSGVQKKELPILKLVQESMFRMLKVTDGKSEPYKEIIFAHAKSPETIACTYYPANVLCVNKNYLENIDEIIKCNIKVLEIMEWIKRDNDGKYKIPNVLRNNKGKQFEKLLNEYTPNWSLKEKFLFDTLETYYHSLASLTIGKPRAAVKKLLENKDNYRLLADKGLIKKEEDLLPINTSWREYLYEIGEYCKIPENACLITYPEAVFNHEYIHKWCFDNFSIKYLDELNSKPVLQKWKNDKKTQLIANSVSIRAAHNPMEYIAEVGAGLVNGQKFNKEIMALYESLKGPILTKN